MTILRSFGAIVLMLASIILLPMEKKNFTRHA